MWGNLWESFINNDFRDVELDDITKYHVVKFIQTVPIYHSIYLRGSFLERNITGHWTGSMCTSEHSDIDFVIIVPTKEDVKMSMYGKGFKYKINRMPCDVKVIDYKRFSKYPNDLFLEVFPLKLVEGEEDLSLRKIDLTKIEHDYHDKYKTLRNQLDNPQCRGRVRDAYTAKKYIKRLLRNCFDTVGPQLGMHTRSLDYCQYFFSEVYPEHETLTTKLLDVFLNTNRYGWDDIQKLVSESEVLIDFIENYGRSI
tara:strand:+ start:4296 stop:5057 length:762 start_codon:yes stop_codon:yes gene_type:complete